MSHDIQAAVREIGWYLTLSPHSRLHQLVQLSGLDVLSIRDANETDMQAVQAIYTHHVLHSLATFEEVPPLAIELNARREVLMQRSLGQGDRTLPATAQQRRPA